MGINTGGDPLGPKFPRRRIQRSPYKGFRNPPPFNPLTGHYEPLLPGSDNSTIRVSVVSLTNDSSGIQYLCNVVNENVASTEQQVLVKNLTDPSNPVDVPAGTLAIAHVINDEYWMQAGDESSLVSTVDFFVDAFDRTNGEDLGSLWRRPSAFLIDSGDAVSALDRPRFDSEAIYRPVYDSKLSASNFTVKARLALTSQNTAGAYLMLGPNPDAPQSGYCIFVFARADLILLYIMNPRADTTLDVVASDSASGADIWTPSAFDLTVAYDGSEISASAIGLQASYTAGPVSPYVGLLSDEIGDRIDTLKAWVGTASEPSDTESGHGDFTDGQFVYTDKYHTSGTYDPLA